ncbi:MAG: hypothetical protein WAL66_15725 [Nitrososphaeraceae archaeon]
MTLTAVLNPNQDSTNATYEEIHTVLIDYPQNSQIATLLKNSPGRIAISATSLPTEQNKENAAAMQTFLEGINQALTNAHSNVQATSASLKFIADVKHYSSTESIVAQRTLLTLGLQDYMLPNNQDPNHKFVDFNWRAFTVNQPIVLSYPDNKTGATKNIEINYMSGVLNAAMPGFTNALKRAGATEKTTLVLQTPVIDYNKLSESMDRWYVLFDPAASLVETQGYGYKGEANGARVDTIYSLGEGSFRERTMNPIVYNSNFGTSPNSYSLSFTVPPPAARIDLLGYSKMTTFNDRSVAIISNQNEGGSSYAGNFPLVVLSVLGGMMGGIVAFVLFKTRTSKQYTTSS